MGQFHRSAELLSRKLESPGTNKRLQYAEACIRERRGYDESLVELRMLLAL